MAGGSNTRRESNKKLGGNGDGDANTRPETVWAVLWATSQDPSDLTADDGLAIGSSNGGQADEAVMVTESSLEGPSDAAKPRKADSPSG